MQAGYSTATGTGGTVAQFFSEGMFRFSYCSFVPVLVSGMEDLFLGFPQGKGNILSSVLCTCEPTRFQLGTSSGKGNAW